MLSVCRACRNIQFLVNTECVEIYCIFRNCCVWYEYFWEANNKRRKWCLLNPLVSYCCIIRTVWRKYVQELAMSFWCNFSGGSPSCSENSIVFIKWVIVKNACVFDVCRKRRCCWGWVFGVIVGVIKTITYRDICVVTPISNWIIHVCLNLNVPLYWSSIPVCVLFSQLKWNDKIRLIISSDNLGSATNIAETGDAFQ